MIVASGADVRDVRALENVFRDALDQGRLTDPRIPQEDDLVVPGIGWHAQRD
jgi:hypothetical protein